jgi:hypothetical protein
MNERVQGKVENPGMALIAVGVLTCLSAFVGIAYGFYDGFVNETGLISLAQWGGLGLCQLAAGIVIALGGARLRSASGAGWVWAAVVVTLLPCCTWTCCCFTGPAGIWAIIAMMDDAVKEAFALNG